MMSRLRRAAAVLATALVLLLLGGAHTAAPAVTQPAADGRELFLRNCASCHGPAGGGTSQAPPLTGWGPAGVDFQLRTGRMPLGPGETYEAVHRDPRLSSEDIEAIVGYVTALGIAGPAVPNVRPSDVQTGQLLFLATCAGCHSSTGIGGALSSGMFSPSLMRATPTEVGEAIRTGPGAMPRFPETVLTDQNVDAIAAYVRTLQGKQSDMGGSDLDRGGLSLGRIGPVTEGMVGWAIAVLLLVLMARWLGSRAR